MSVLQEIVASTRAELARRKRELPPARLQEMAQARLEEMASAQARLPAESGPGRLIAALRRPGIGVIAEIKRRSPSAGTLRADVDVTAIAAAYAACGASAISVLTDGPYFGGSLADLQAVRATCELPILRKDFVVEDYQLQEALLAGADAVLLIVAALSDPQLAALHRAAGQLGLDALVEVHDEQELQRALAAGAQLVGVNNRDLRDFSVDVERTFALLAQVPPQVTLVSESGIERREQVDRLRDAGVHGVLVGGSLMAAEDPGLALRALTGSFIGADDPL